MKVTVNKVNTLVGHKDCIYTLEKGLTDNEFYSAAGDGSVAKWSLKDSEKGELIAKLDTSVYALCLVPEKNVLIIGKNFDGIHLIDLNIKKIKKSLNITTKAIFDIKFYHNQIFIASADGYLYVVNYETLNMIQKIKVSHESVRSIAINEAHQHLALGCSDNSIKLLMLNNLKTIREISAHNNSVFTLQYTPDNKFLLSAGRDAHLNIWNIAKGYELEESIVAHMYAINHICFNPDKLYFATCSMDKSVKIWDARQFKLLKVIDKGRHAGHAASVNKLFWSSYQNQLISCGDDRNISIWDLKFSV